MQQRVWIMYLLPVLLLYIQKKIGIMSGPLETFLKGNFWNKDTYS